MSTKLAKHNILTQMLSEAEHYQDLTSIEACLENKDDFSQVPAQPLFFALKNSTMDQIIEVLPKLNKEQRQFLVDASVWDKDQLDISHFENLLDVYAKINTLEIQEEFVKNDEFLLYLKSRCNIHTFEIEDQNYPDHDNFFLTDDNLFLIEFDENFNYSEQLQYLLKIYYSFYGVEQAYRNLYTLILDSFVNIEETAYVDKTDRLRDYGLLSYHEALSWLAPFKNNSQLDHFIKNKNTRIPKIENFIANQTLHYSVLRYFENNQHSLYDLVPASHVNDSNHIDYIKFDFIKTINAGLSLKGIFNSSALSLNKGLDAISHCIYLGASYIKIMKDKNTQIEDYVFSDFYRVGISLIYILNDRLKKINPTAFWGDNLNSLIHSLMESHPKFNNEYVTSMEQLDKVLKVVDFIEKFSSYIRSLESQFKNLVENSQINDQFYLNYSVNDIDFESILISLFIHFDLNNEINAHQPKLGIATTELKTFVLKYFQGKIAQIDNTNGALNKKIMDFSEKLAEQSAELNEYLMSLLNTHLSGYEYSEMSDDDFAHLGGPILLKN